MGKKSSGKTVLIVILIVLLLGACGYIVYDKFIKEEPKEIKNEVKETKTESFNIKNKSTLQVLYLDSFSIYVDKAGDAFLTLDNESDMLDEQGKASFNKLIKEYKEYPLEGYTLCGGEDKPNIIEAIKLPVNNVIAAYESLNGQDEQYYYALFVKADGTVSGLKVADLLHDSKVTIIDNINNLKDIVSIAKSFSANACSGYSQTLAIDKAGHQHILDFY